MTAAAWKKLIALLLVLVLLFSLLPAALAAEGEGEGGAAEPAASSEPGDGNGGDSGGDPGETGTASEPAGSSEGGDPAGEGGSGENGPGTGGDPGETGGTGENGQGGEPGGENEPGTGGDPGETGGTGENGTGSEPGSAGDGENDKPEEPDKEEEEPEPAGSGLPYNLPGMPWGYTLSVAEREAKVALTSHNTQELLKTCGYTADTVLLLTDRMDYAETVAAAYNAELVSFDGFFAELRLRTITVPQAIGVAADLNNNMPAVEPDWIITLDPEPMVDDAAAPAVGAQSNADDPFTWYNWVETLGLNDPYVQNPADSRYQWMHDTVNSYEAWGISMGSPDIVVAVLDTGVAAGHQDLGTILPGYNAPDQNSDVTDTVGHGTHVAGVIAAQGFNGRGGVGIAPGVSILPVKVMRERSGSNAWLARGINWAVNHGANILNMSLGGPGYSSVVEEAVRNAWASNVTVIAAMSNGTYGGSNIRYYPGAYSHVVAVAATDRANARASFSHYGSWCSLAAPGQSILSTTPSGYGFMSGTSQATPIVSGAAALYMSVYGVQTPDTMKRLLKAATNKAEGSGIGTGVLDVGKLLNGNVPAPGFSTEADGEKIAGSSVSLSSADRVYILPGVEDDYDRIIYTVGDRVPAMLNGTIRSGQLLPEGTPIYLNNYSVGDSVLIRARRVNGQGVASKVVALRVNIADPVDEDQLERIAVRITSAPAGPLVAGKSITLKAEAYSTVGTSVSPDVVWSIVSQPEGFGANIDRGGKLTTRPGVAGTVTVRAASKLRAESYKDIDVTVDTLPPVRTVTMNAASLTLYAGGSAAYGTAQLTATCVTVEGQTLNPDEISLRWTSSNGTVAAVDENGVVTALARGSATIKAFAQDGSGRSAVCSVTVRQFVTDIDVTGQENIAPGASATMKAAVLPGGANNRGVSWKIGSSSSPGLNVSVSAKGVVKVGAGVPANSWFEVLAEAKDGSGVVGSHTVWVMPKTAAVRVWTDDSEIVPITDKNGNTTGAMLYRQDIGNHTLQLEARREYKIDGETTWAYDALIWSSSNSRVATVDEYGYVTAVSVGKATITAKANDGSGKKAGFTVRVINPASSLTLSSKAPVDSRYVAFGKSIGIRAAVGDTYGKPTLTDLNWSFTVWSEYGEDPELTQYLKSKKLIALNRSGTLTVKSGARSWGIDYIVVRAETRDGTGIYDEIEIWPVEAAKKIRLQEKTVYLSLNDPANAGRTATIYILSDGECTDYAVTSNNPKIAGGYIKRGDFIDENGVAHKNEPMLVIYAGTKIGATAIKVRACDGSGKYAAVVVRVK